MSSKALALTAIATQVVLGLILVAILATLQAKPAEPAWKQWCQPGQVMACHMPDPVRIVP